ncbi:BTAD domain-containing putative transcriptional regulator [Petrocella sp. FN5]|uniref:BTAD domain-containing putative transcriptional regulator n=1 Tax=Petrocella sp. FN5 TaxID=3032002 RepID=UPI0023DA0EAF|nr:BTAD domain-containing putative transcriptional regulator [Petrocella sp. FN5]MDF1617909.1 BTAD domain-containing putative transcriptional regulator [Petrocella sp. FN5]
MQNTLLLKSKLIIPELPKKALYSERIKSLPINKKRAVIITAPGGFGKTTAVLLSLKKERQYIHWYRLEREDAFLPVFYSHVIETLFSGVDKTRLDCYRGLSGISNISEEYSLINALICQDAWEYFSDEQHFHYLVLDDFQNIVENPLISETVRYFIANMPIEIGMLVMSRVDTSIFTGKLALNNNITLINEDDLRFTREETEKLLLNTYKIKSTTKELDRIHEFSEGWIAGLFMISHIDNPLPYQSNYGLEADYATEQTLFNHFFNEYLKGMDVDRLQILAEMSIFPDFSYKELDEILQVDNALEMLEWLEKSNMYIQKFMTQPVKYRFHSLFRRELEVYLKKIKSEAYIKTLYAKAAHYYEKNEDLRPAVQLYIAADQTNKALKIISIFGAQLFAKGQPEKIMYLVTEFPENIIKGDPYLLFFRGLMLLTTEIEEAYDCFKAALLMLRYQKDMSYLMNTFGMILVMSFQTNDFKYAKDVASYIPKFKVALSGGIPLKKLLISGFINTVADEKLILGNVLSKMMARMIIPEAIWDYSFLTIRALLFYRIGRLKSARKILDQILEHQVGLLSDQWRIIGLVGCYSTLMLMRDIEASKKLMTEFALLGEKYDSDFSRSFALEISAVIKYQTRDIVGAISDLEEEAAAYSRYGSPIFTSGAMILKYLWEAEIVPAQTLLEKAELEFANISKQYAGHGYYEFCQGMMGALYKAAGNYEKAEDFLLSSYNESFNKKARQHMSTIAMHLADLYYRKNCTKLLKKYLNIWARLSSKNDYVFFFGMDYFTLIRACALAIEKNLFPEHMRKIIGLYFGSVHSERMVKNSGIAVTNPNSFITACCESEEKVQKIIKVTLFGNFSIQKGEVIIENKEWKTRKISGILKYILAHSGKSISRETLSGVFWPDSDKKAAFTSLRVALYELRKTLDRFGMGFEDEYPLIIEEKNGFCISSKNLVETDVEEFCRLYNTYKSQTLPAEDLLTKMTDLYTGDFLEDNSYDEWVSLSQEYYKAIYIEVSHTLLQLLLKKDALKEAESILEKHMRIDPYDEKACELLLRVYQHTGQNARANSFMRQFEKRFKAEMGVEPNLNSL